MLTGSVCKRVDFRTYWFDRWATRMGFPGAIHRKFWEWTAITQALFERDMLREGRHGIGFAVGTEPLASLFADLGAHIYATDLAQGEAAAPWTTTEQHAASAEAVFHPGIVDRETFEQRVTFAAADMNDLSPWPSNNFDFLWSSCAIEHLGTLDRGMDFVRNAMRLLKPGGIACHTTEFNVSSLDDTITEGENVIYRECDIRGLSGELRKIFCVLEPMNFDPGDEPEDVLYDVPPYYENQRTHIKLELGGFICTSAMIICRKYI